MESEWEVADTEGGVLKNTAKRLPWLVLLLGLGLLVSGVAGYFERVVENLSVIVSFQSLVLGMAGNAGTQSLAVTIRTLSEGGVGRRRRLCLLVKEVLIGILNGVALGVISFLVVGIYLSAARGEEMSLAFGVSLCTGAAMLISVAVSAFFGTAVPLAFAEVGIDPAVASGPLITTLNDLVAVLSFYGITAKLLASTF